WVLAAPLLTVGTGFVATPVIVVLLLLSVFILTKTPPNKIGDRLRELYAYLFGAQLPDADERAAQKSGRADTGLVFNDLGDEEDPASIPWWRRNKTRREEDPA